MNFLFISGGYDEIETTLITNCQGLDTPKDPGSLDLSPEDPKDPDLWDLYGIFGIFRDL